MAAPKKQNGHPVMRMPLVADFYRSLDGTLRSKEQVKALYDEACRLRAVAIAKEKSDPIRFGWEPPIWKVCDALLGLPLFDTAFEQTISWFFGTKRLGEVFASIIHFTDFTYGVETTKARRE